MNLPDHLLPWLASLCLLLGAVLSMLGALGVWRLPDAYSRLHAASKAGALGAMLLFAGAALGSAGAWSWPALAGILALLLSAPLGAHAIARAAYRAGDKPRLGPLGDDLQRTSQPPPGER